ncbi:MAG: hypothetical protein R3D02_03735 [Hyphomicrobiales bacterium]
MPFAECANVGALLKNEFSLAMENEIMGAILDDSAGRAAAGAWLKVIPRCSTAGSRA